MFTLTDFVAIIGLLFTVFFSAFALGYKIGRDSITKK